jgi:CTP:molybdopterin cytidylyltransferase MocA
VHPTGEVTGLLLAAGAGRRIGTPKALLREADGRSFLDRAISGLLDGGCNAVTVVVGATAGQVVELVGELKWANDSRVQVTAAKDWDEGMGASLRAGLSSLGDEFGSAVVNLVDLPDVGAAVVRRLLTTVGTRPAALGRATYDGRPGHPVVLGRDHWAEVIATARGDRGARDYLRARPGLELVECADLATGRDVDTLDDL